MPNRRHGPQKTAAAVLGLLLLASVATAASWYFGRSRETTEGVAAQMLPPATSNSHAAVSPSANEQSEVAAPFEPSLVYLDDLPEKTYDVVRRLGKHGLDNSGEPFTWQGKQPAHALFVHPGYDGASRVVYDLEGKYRWLRVTAALADSVTERTSVPLTFRIVVDGQTLRETRNKLQFAGEYKTYVVPITGVRELRLEVECPGNNGMAHAVWIDPCVTTAAELPRSSESDPAPARPRTKKRPPRSP
jgi:hypothetical protein